MSYGESIKYFRRSKSLTQKDLAEMIGCDIRTYQKYESGEINIKISTLQKISSILGVSLYKLCLFGDENFGSIEHLKKLRKLNNMTQKDLAEKLNLSTSLIQKYESGERKMTYETYFEALKCMNSIEPEIDILNKENNENIEKLIQDEKLKYADKLITFGDTNNIEYNKGVYDGLSLALSIIRGEVYEK